MDLIRMRPIQFAALYHTATASNDRRICRVPTTLSVSVGTWLLKWDCLLSLVLTHFSSRNRLPPIGINRSSGGLPSGQGASPFFLIQSPMAGLRSSGNIVQNPFVSFTGIVSFSTLIRTRSQCLSKNRSTFARPTRTPRTTARGVKNSPLFQPETSTPDLPRTCLAATVYPFSFCLCYPASQLE